MMTVMLTICFADDHRCHDCLQNPQKTAGVYGLITSPRNTGQIVIDSVPNEYNKSD